MKKKTVSTITLAVVIALVVAITAFYIVRFASSTKFLKVSEKVQKIPGMMQGFIPQGLTYMDEAKLYLVCGYMDNGSASRIYKLDGNGDTSVIYLQKQDGSTYTGHAGGITAVGDYIYISNASKIFVLNAADVQTAPDGSTLAFIGAFQVPCRASFCSSDGVRLYVGDYHAAGYQTAENHTIRVSDGDTYHAVTYGFNLDPAGQFGVADTTCPDIAFSTCDRVQGFAIVGNRAVLSCSGGLANSKLRLYTATGTDSTLRVNGRDIPLVMLDNSRHILTLTMPQRSEDIEFRNSRLYIGFEAGARKFGLGIIPVSIRTIRSIDLSVLMIS